MTSESRAGGLVAPICDPHDPAFQAVAEVPGRPRVLLLGDSISIGYTLGVRAALAGRATVCRPADNCGQTAYAQRHLDQWLGHGRWDVIHFNFGLHDLKYLDAAGNYVPPDRGRQVASPAEYARNLESLVIRLKRTGARLIFATTTPVPGGAAGRVEHSERAYNAVAVALMLSHGVAVNDLWSHVAPCQEKLLEPRDVHFTPEGSRVLGELVARQIERALGREGPPAPCARPDL